MVVRSNDAGSTDNSMMGQLSSSKGLKGSDVVVDVPDSNQESCKKGIGGPNEVEDIENCPDLMSYKCKFRKYLFFCIIRRLVFQIRQLKCIN